MEELVVKNKKWRTVFFKRKSVKAAFAFLLFMLSIALLSSIIANEKPLYIKYKGQSFFPAFSISGKGEVNNSEKEFLIYNQVDWKNFVCDKKIFPLVPYSPEKSDYANADYQSPGSNQQIQSSRFRHWLGTNKRGEDVLAGIIYGSRISLLVGFLSILIAALIGITLGAIAGFFGDDEIKTSRAKMFLMTIGLFPAWFYSFHLRQFILDDAWSSSAFTFTSQFLFSILIFITIILLFSSAGKVVSRINYFSKPIRVPVDACVSRLIEWLISLPRLILIISIAAISKPSISNLILIIGLTSWTEIARLTRAEILRIKNLDYITAARALGYKRGYVLFRHALPNGLGPAFVAITFGITSAILAESGLSFLGIGVPPDTVTWGSLLASGRENFDAWWLVVFPGLALFLTITSLNIIGDTLRDVLDPKLKI